MADKDPGKDGPSLELPSFLGGRRRKRPEPEPAVTSEPEPERESDREPEREREGEPEPTAVLPASAAAPQARADRPARHHPASPRTESQPEPQTEPKAQPPAEPQPDSQPRPDEPAEQEPRRRRTGLPPLPGLVAAALTGVLVGLLLVALTYLGLQGCEAARGTSSCGGPGFFGLLVIVGLVTWLAAMLLAAWKVPDPGTTALLATGLLVVVALLFLIDLLFEWWMVIAIPLVSLLTHVLSWWVTTSVVGDDDSPRA